MKIEEKIRQRLLLRGWSENYLLNNRGLIGAVIDEMKKDYKPKILKK